MENETEFPQYLCEIASKFEKILWGKTRTYGVRYRYLFMKKTVTKTSQASEATIPLSNFYLSNQRTAARRAYSRSASGLALFACNMMMSKGITGTYVTVCSADSDLLGSKLFSSYITSVADPDKLNPDPAFFLNPVPDLDPDL